jgi:hypothetical protein
LHGLRRQKLEPE